MNKETVNASLLGPVQLWFFIESCRDHRKNTAFSILNINIIYDIKQLCY